MSTHRRLCLLLAVCRHTYVEGWANLLGLHRCVGKAREEFCTTALGLESLYDVYLSVSCISPSSGRGRYPQGKRSTDFPPGGKEKENWTFEFIHWTWLEPQQVRIGLNDVSWWQNFLETELLHLSCSNIWHQNNIELPFIQPVDVSFTKCHSKSQVSHGMTSPFKAQATAVISLLIWSLCLFSIFMWHN